MQDERDVSTSFATVNACLSTLQDRCLYFIIRHIDGFLSGLGLLPLSIQKRLLLNLPAVDIWRLEASGVTRGLDVESLWRSLIEDRCEHVSRKHYHHPFYQKMPARDLYFTIVWYQALQDKDHTLFSVLHCKEGRDLSMLLYAVPCVLGIDGFSFSERNYCPQSRSLLRNVIQNDPAVRRLLSPPYLRQRLVFLAIIRYFGEVCCISPRYFCFHCLTVGKHSWPWVLSTPQSNAVLQSFMANLEGVRFDGNGKLAIFSKDEEQEQHKKFFINIPSLFVGAAVANPKCNLKSIEIDASDCRRARGLLEGVKEGVSMKKYTKLQRFSIQISSTGEYRTSYFDGNEGLTRLHVISLLSQIIKVQLFLHSLVIQFPAKIEPIRESTTAKDYSEFISMVTECMNRPHFEMLILRNVLTFHIVQVLIHTFLSLPVSSHSQLLDIRKPEDIQQSDTVFSSPCNDPLKSLKVSGMVHDDSKEYLSSLVVQKLSTIHSIHCLELVDTIDGIVSALKQPIESLQVRNLCLTIRDIASSVDEAKTPEPTYHRISAHDERQVPPQAYRWGRRQHLMPDDTIDILRAREFPDLPKIDAIISNSSLCALKICFLSPKDFISSSQAPDLLRIISDGLRSPSCNLQVLTLPKVNCLPDNDKDFQYFSDSVFGLSHVDTFELYLSIVTFSEQYATIFHSSWKHQCEKRGTVRLAKLVLQCDTVKAESREPLILLMKDVCIDLVML